MFCLLIDALELGCQLATQPIEDMTLKIKSSGESKHFSLLSEEKFMSQLDRNAKVSHFDMSKLEVEYDYDTDRE